MAGNYEKNIYNHLMEVMARLEHVERETGQEISKLNTEISDLKNENQILREENRLLKDDNARLKSIPESVKLTASQFIKILYF